MEMRKFRFIMVSFVLLAPAILIAQEEVSKKDLRKQKSNFLMADKPWTLELPLWIPGFAGQFSYGDIEIEGEDGVDPANPTEPPPGGLIGKIFKRLFSTDWKLNFFYLTKISYEKEHFIVQLDAITGAVGESTKFKYNDTQVVQANFRTTNVRLIGGYKIIDTQTENNTFQYELIGYMGIRTHFHKIHSDLNSTINTLDISPWWIEPVLGIQNQFTWKRWFAVLQSDYGGYFVESKYSFQFTTYVYYRSGKATSLKLGWNHLHLVHSDSFLRQDYNIIASFSGPSIGLILHF